MSGTQRETRTRQTLQEFYEQLDGKWREAEELLLSLSVPAPVTQTIRTAEPEFPRAPRSRHELGFIRHYGRWGLCYGVCSEDDPHDQYWTSIHRCSIEQRVEAAQAFPALRDQILDAAERYTDTVAQALSVLSGSLSPQAEVEDAAPAAVVLQTEEPPADEPSRAAESADLLADEPECEYREESAEPTRAVAADSSAEPVISADAEILGPIEPDRSLILWSAPECLIVDAQACDAPAAIFLPRSLQYRESDGGEIVRDAA